MMDWSGVDNCEVAVNVPDTGTLLAELDHRFRVRQGFSVATLNLDHVVKLRRDPTFRKAYAAHSHVTADGNPIVWLSKLAGRREVSLIPGSELIQPIARLAAKNMVKVALFGSRQDTLDISARALQSEIPDLQIVSAKAPSMAFDPTGPEADAAIIQIHRSGARLVLLALGAPKQEVFAARAASQLPEVGFLSIGAGLDFISGHQSRAPIWLRRLSLEWLWRLLGNPRRLAKRYLSCFLILPLLLMHVLAFRLRERALR